MTFVFAVIIGLMLSCIAVVPRWSEEEREKGEREREERERGCIRSSTNS
jgi:MFS superfamily sulfate permease-like transporter